MSHYHAWLYKLFVNRQENYLNSPAIPCFMALKCEICKEKIETTFLGKIEGTYFVKGKKKVAVCRECQKRYGNKLKELIKL